MQQCNSVIISLTGRILWWNWYFIIAKLMNTCMTVICWDFVCKTLRCGVINIPCGQFGSQLYVSQYVLVISTNLAWQPCMTSHVKRRNGKLYCTSFKRFFKFITCLLLFVFLKWSRVILSSKWTRKQKTQTKR